MIEPEPYSREQKRHLSEVSASWQDRAPLLLEQQELVGGLQWKKVGANEYLYRYQPDPITRKKRSTSLGRRGPATEAAYSDFISRRQAVTAAIESGSEDLETQARVSKALRLGRVPVDVAEVFLALWSGRVSDHLMLVSDQAAFGFETVFLSRIASPGADGLNFCALDDDILEEMFPELERAMIAMDKTAEITRQDGEVLVMGKAIAVRFSSPSTFLSRWSERFDVTHDQQEALAELLGLEPVPVLTISRSGAPAPVQVPDPRAFAFMNMAMDEGRFEIGSVIAALAARTDAYQFADDILEAMPELADAVGVSRSGPRM